MRLWRSVGRRGKRAPRGVIMRRWAKDPPRGQRWGFACSSSVPDGRCCLFQSGVSRALLRVYGVRLGFRVRSVSEWSIPGVAVRFRMRCAPVNAHCVQLKQAQALAVALFETQGNRSQSPSLVLSLTIPPPSRADPPQHLHTEQTGSRSGRGHSSIA